jgi:hypothetical protein
MGMPVMEYLMERKRGRRKESRAREDDARKPKPPFRSGSVASNQLSSGKVGVRVRSERNWRAIFSIPKIKREWAPVLVRESVEAGKNPFLWKKLKIASRLWIRCGLYYHKKNSPKQDSLTKSLMTPNTKPFSPQLTYPQTQNAFPKPMPVFIQEFGLHVLGGKEEPQEQVLRQQLPSPRSSRSIESPRLAKTVWSCYEVLLNQLSPLDTSPHRDADASLTRAHCKSYYKILCCDEILKKLNKPDFMMNSLKLQRLAL